MENVNFKNLPNSIEKSHEIIKLLQARLFDKAEVDITLAKLDAILDAESIDIEEEKMLEQKTKARGKRKPLPANVPREDRVIELAAAELVCEVDGSSLVVIGEEVSERLEIIPKQV